MTPAESSLLGTQNNQKALDFFYILAFRSTAGDVCWHVFKNTSPTFSLVRNEKWRKAREARETALILISKIVDFFWCYWEVSFVTVPPISMARRLTECSRGIFSYSTGNRKIYDFLFARFTDLDFSQLTDHGKLCHQQNSNDVISGYLLLRYDASGSVSFETPPETGKTLSV